MDTCHCFPPFCGFGMLSCWNKQGRVAESVVRLTQESEVPGSMPGPATNFPFTPSASSRRVVVSYWRKYVHLVLVNRLGGLSLPRNSVVRLTDCPDMTIPVDRGRKTPKQHTKSKMVYSYRIEFAPRGETR